MSKTNLFKVREYILEKYHVFFACVYGEVLYSHHLLSNVQVEDILSVFPGLGYRVSALGNMFGFNLV